MRRLIPVVLLLLGAACNKKPVGQTIEEQDAGLASTLNLGDPRTASQLKEGFYGIEQRAWRWTMGRFSVMLKPPRGASQNGAKLEMQFTVPPAMVERLKSVTVTAHASDIPLSSETYTKPGPYTYTSDVPRQLMTGDIVRVDFTLDKFLAAGMVDQRELGLVVKSIGLVSK